jgi:hypothetical protein
MSLFDVASVGRLAPFSGGFLWRGTRFERSVQPGRANANVFVANAHARVTQRAGANQPPNRSLMATRAFRRLTECQPGIAVNLCGDWRLKHAPILGRIDAGRLSLLFDLGIPTF